MGNYKSRPRSSCSQELYKNILQNYAQLAEKIQEDLHVQPDNLTHIQQVCSNGTVDQLASLLNPETVGERLYNGMTLLHLCCMAAVTAKTDSVRDMEISQVEGRNNVLYDTNVLQLVRSSRERSVHDDGNHDHLNESSNIYVQHSKQTRDREVKEQIRLLLKRGADPAIISKNGYSPLHIASYKVKTTP